MRIAIGCDHRGLALKQFVIRLVTEARHTCEGLGCDTADPVDYPDIAKKLAEAVARGDFDRGILTCSTGIGMSIAANKVSGIRAALCHDTFGACRARQHNNANVLCLGAEGQSQITATVDDFLTRALEGDRHRRRLDKITAMED